MKYFASLKLCTFSKWKRRCRNLHIEEEIRITTSDLSISCIDRPIRKSNHGYPVCSSFLLEDTHVQNHCKYPSISLLRRSSSKYIRSVLYPRNLTMTPIPCPSKDSEQGSKHDESLSQEALKAIYGNVEDKKKAYEESLKRYVTHQGV